MNTINLITSIALLACILTPAYVLYYLKHFVGGRLKKQEQKIDSLIVDINRVEQSVEQIQFDEIEKRVDRTNELQSLNKEIDDLASDVKMVNSIFDNNFENINVQQDYLRKTLDKEISALEHKLSIHDKKLIKLSKSYESLTEDKQVTKEEPTTQDIAQEVEQEEPTTKEQKISEYEHISFRLRKSKKESKRVIRSRELEKYFKEVTKLTFRGYVLKFGQEEFQKKRLLVYKKLYYQKFIKPLTSDITPTQIEMEM